MNREACASKQATKPKSSRDDVETLHEAYFLKFKCIAIVINSASQYVSSSGISFTYSNLISKVNFQCNQEYETFYNAQSFRKAHSFLFSSEKGRGVKQLLALHSEAANHTTRMASAATQGMV